MVTNPDRRATHFWPVSHNVPAAADLPRGSVGPPVMRSSSGGTTTRLVRTAIRVGHRRIVTGIHGLSAPQRGSHLLAFTVSDVLAFVSAGSPDAAAWS